MNLGMYITNKLFHGWFACTIFNHSLFTFRPFPRMPLLMAFYDHTAITCVALIKVNKSLIVRKLPLLLDSRSLQTETAANGEGFQIEQQSIFGLL